MTLYVVNLDVREPRAQIVGDFSTRPSMWRVVNVMGQGPVPGYDPATAPAGPVMGGSCEGGALTGTF